MPSRQTRDTGSARSCGSPVSASIARSIPRRGPAPHAHASKIHSTILFVPFPVPGFPFPVPGSLIHLPCIIPNHLHHRGFASEHRTDRAWQTLRDRPLKINDVNEPCSATHGIRKLPISCQNVAIASDPFNRISVHVLNPVFLAVCDHLHFVL